MIKSQTYMQDDLNYILDNTRDLWQEFRKQKIFITGGTGFFGCWLLETLICANNVLGLDLSITVLTRDFARFKLKAPHIATNPLINFIVGDIYDFQYPQSKFTYVIHAAADLSVNYNHNDLFFLDKITIETKRILDFALFCNASKILLTSSGAVYGRQPATIANMSEEYLDIQTPAENNAYAKGKMLVENLFTEYSIKLGIQAKIARCFAFVGPYLPLDMHYAVGNFILNGLRHEDILIKGDGTTRRSYMYAADLVIWLLHILVRGESCRPYNVGSEKSISIQELAHLVARFFSYNPTITIGKKHQISSPVEQYVPATQRSRVELSLPTIIDLPEALSKTINWCKKFAVQ